MAAPLDSLIGEGLAPSPYAEMRAERDALRHAVSAHNESCKAACDARPGCVIRGVCATCPVLHLIATNHITETP